MLEGTCPKCSYHLIGWALRFPRYQTCPRCGVGLEIMEDEKIVSTGYSPFTAEKYFLNLPPNVPAPHDHDKAEDNAEQNNPPLA